MKWVKLWAPVVALFLLILATLPLGPTFGLVLKRLGATTTAESWTLPASGVEVVDSGGLTAVRLLDGRLVVRQDGEPVLTAVHCLGIYVASNEALCAAGPDGLIRVSPEGEVLGALALDAPVSTVTRAGRAVVLGTVDGGLRVVTADGGQFELAGALEGIAGDIVALFPVDGAVIVADADGDIIGVSLSDPTAPVVVGSSRVTERIVDLTTYGNTGMVAAGGDGVVIVDLSDLGRAVALKHLPLGDVRDVHVSNGNLTWAVVEGGGAHAVIHTREGPVFSQSPHGEEARVTAIAGRPPLQAALAGDQLLMLDTQPSEDGLILGVGALALLGMGVIIGPFLVRREDGWQSKLVWIGLGVVVLGWLLVDRKDNPIEALHILEYGALGALLVRALVPVGGGISAALLAVLITACAALFDETVQFLLPTRSGDIEDVWLDLQAGAIGAVVGIQVWTAGRRASWAWPAYVGAALIVGVALFQHVTVGYGHALTVGDLSFTSRLREDALRRTDRDHGVDNAATLERTAAMGYGIFLSSFPARAEPFLYELRVHLFRRDRRMEKDDLEVACGEERLLQELFAQSYSGTSWEWSDAMRARCVPFADVPYHSPVSEEIMTGSGPLRLWGGTLLGVIFLVGMGVRFRRRDAEGIPR